jgi:hypothetical protein
MARERQIDFPPEQTHHPLVTPVALGVAVVCVALVIILLVAGVEGPFIGPWG